MEVAEISEAALELRTRKSPTAAMTYATNTPTKLMGSPVIYVGVLHQCDPAIFRGAEEHDVQDMLSCYERVSANNNWDELKKLYKLHILPC